MRAKTKRDVTVFLGAVAIIGVVAFVNIQLNRGNLAAEFEAMRTRLEGERSEEGLEFLSWGLIKKTKGSLRSGGQYQEELLEHDQVPVNLMGFMVPQEQFRDVTEFLLLPIPLECYFCSMPPARDVMLIQLAEGETTDIYSTPVIISGNFNIHEGSDVKFFYAITEGHVGAGDPEAGLKKRRLELQHMLPKHEKDPSLLLDPVYNEDSD